VGDVRIGSNVNLRQRPVYSSPWILSEIAPELWTTAPSGTVKIGPWAAGVQVKHFSLGSTEIRSPDGDVRRTIDSYQQSVKLATAFEVTPHLTVGGGVNLIRSRLGGIRNTGDTKVHPTVDLGIQYQTQVEWGFMTLRPALGVSLTDFGGNVSYKDQRGDLSAPTTIRGGGALDVTSQSRQFGRPEWRIGLYGALSNLLASGKYVEENGDTYFEADGPFTALFNGWGPAKGRIQPDGEPASIGSWERIAKHAGLELSVLDVFSLRLGRYHENRSPPEWQYTALGLGLDAYYVALDASWTLDDEDAFQDFSYGRLTVRIPLSDSPRNFWPALLGNGE
jgi:hypothetical protein